MIIFKIYFRLGNRGWWWFSFSYIVGLCYAWLVPKISLAGRPALYKVRCSSEIWFVHVPMAVVSQKRAWLRRFATAKLIVARFRCHSADLKMPTAHVIILGLAFVASSCTGNTWNFWPFAFVNAYIHRVPKWLRSTRIRPWAMHCARKRQMRFCVLLALVNFVFVVGLRDPERFWFIVLLSFELSCNVFCRQTQWLLTK